jgi:hypothetical protein
MFNLAIDLQDSESNIHNTDLFKEIINKKGICNNSRPNSGFEMEEKVAKLMPDKQTTCFSSFFFLVILFLYIYMN